MPASTFLPTFSVCVCTRDNPDGLRQTLQSIFESTMPPHEILVSDDSSNYETRQMMRESYAAIPYLEGPRRSQAANRNRLVRAATGSHVLFLDDRTLLGTTFLQQMAERFADDYIHRAQVEDVVAPLILTGMVLQRGRRSRPRKTTFLGYPSQEYRCGERLLAVELPSAVFPRELFEHAGFDEALANGYDVTELTDRAVYAYAHRIELMPSAVNLHADADGDEARPSPEREAARLYVTLRRYWHGQHRPVKAAACLAAGLGHCLAVQVLHAGGPGGARFWPTATMLHRLLRSHAADDDTSLARHARI
ncbi:glycosyltransferase family 2 protein [Cupriavidus numazuensis]|uniref:Glycosyltransferase 2-like domain-containing protein n=1 Tax=Cupriavidus numazuensis TaxID=221992 RepID=A0ABN7Q2G0_9BURK|nr:glycosyltransferase family 2 protein [Cupriavidus numazuensis]CAG2141770.1 hypothetical protein LMG26411_02116 [Cupriavidus numazuensis]